MDHGGLLLETLSQCLWLTRLLLKEQIHHLQRDILFAQVFGQVGLVTYFISNKLFNAKDGKFNLSIAY